MARRNTFIIPQTLTARTAALISITGITDSTIIAAVNTFDLYLIANSLSTQFYAMYLVVGGSATTHKYNFFNAVDSDAAFRLAFNGGWTHNANGMLPNGTTGYANTFFNPNTTMSLNDAALSVYNGTNTSTNCIDMGCETGGNVTEVYARYGNSFYTFINQIYSDTVVANTDSRGLFTSTRKAVNNVKGFKNGAEQSVTNNARASSAKPNLNLYIGCSNIAGTAQYFANRRIQFAAMSSGLNSTECANLYTAVQALQTSLSRNV